MKDLVLEDLRIAKESLEFSIKALRDSPYSGEVEIDKIKAVRDKVSNCIRDLKGEN